MTSSSNQPCPLFLPWTYGYAVVITRRHRPLQARPRRRRSLFTRRLPVRADLVLTLTSTFRSNHVGLKPFAPLKWERSPFQPSPRLKFSVATRFNLQEPGAAVVPPIGFFFNAPFDHDLPKLTLGINSGQGWSSDSQTPVPRRSTLTVPSSTLQSPTPFPEVETRPRPATPWKISHEPIHAANGSDGSAFSSLSAA
ncbi:hypothetical protein NMY22_g13812 [Coprinellus aureogranulatus]|nr:hypothetical protein NMY22_g13812 [Coprinellus aureogranulatus]